MKALIFDTETTGFRTSTFTPEIVQIAGILQDTVTRRILGEINLICKTDKPSPTEALRVHLIGPELQQSVGFNPALAERMFAELVQRADVLVAHNIGFDLDIIKGVWPLAHKLVAHKQKFDTMRAATDVIKLPGGRYHGEDFAKHKPPKLIEAYRHFFGGDFEGAHDAMVDVRACRDVYLALLEPAEPDVNIEIHCQTDSCSFVSKAIWIYEVHLIAAHLQIHKANGLGGDAPKLVQPKPEPPKEEVKPAPSGPVCATCGEAINDRGHVVRPADKHTAIPAS